MFTSELMYYCAFLLPVFYVFAADVAIVCNEIVCLLSFARENKRCTLLLLSLVLLLVLSVEYNLSLAQQMQTAKNESANERSNYELELKLLRLELEINQRNLELCGVKAQYAI